jgi:PAS domain S-box-containing protein
VRNQGPNLLSRWNRVWILLLGLGLAAVYWAVDSFIHSYPLRNQSFREAFVRPDLHELSLRILTVSFLLLFAIVFQSFLNRRRGIERALKEAEEEFRTIFESASDVIAYVDTNGVIVDINPEVEHALGYDPRELRGKKITSLGIYPEGVLPYVVEAFARAGRGERFIGDRLELRHKNGSRVFMESSLVGVEKRGRVEAVLVFSRDVSYRVEAEEKLRLGEERWRCLTENTDNHIIIADRNGVIEYVNRTFPPQTPDDVVGSKLTDFLAEEHHERLRKRMEAVFETGQMVEYDGVMDEAQMRSHIGPRWFSTSVVPMISQGEVQRVIIVAKDVTERVRAERELRESTEKWNSLMENTTDVVVVMDGDGRISYANRALPPLSVEETIGRTMFEFMGEEEKALARKKLNRVFQNGETVSYDIRTEIRGVGPRWLSTTIFPVKHGEEVVTVVSITADITDRRRAEEESERLRQQLAYAEKMESLGHLARGVAHEINNPLTSILATAELLLDEMSEAGESRSDVEQIVREAKRIQDTVRSFLGFARTRDFAFEESDINYVVASALKAIGKGQLKGCEVQTHYGDGLGTIKVSRFHMEEVFVNIITNALYSMQGGGTLTVTTERDKESIVVSVKDTGIGIREEDMGKIFEPYFTTRERRGTGLGLSICRDIVMRHGGRIEVDSKGPGRGAEFKVFLPA